MYSEWQLITKGHITTHSYTNVEIERDMQYIKSSMTVECNSSSLSLGRNCREQNDFKGTNNFKGSGNQSVPLRIFPVVKTAVYHWLAIDSFSYTNSYINLSYCTCLIISYVTLNTEIQN